MPKVKYLIIILLLHASAVFCQENMGIANSNYSPTSSVLLNPSSIVDSKVLWEINLMGASAFIDNNYLFFPNSSGKSLLFNSDDIPDPLDTYTASNKWGYADFAIHGPSISFNAGKHAFGINTQVRSITDVRNVPFHLAKFGFEGFTYFPQRGITYFGKNIKANSLTWAELGINYGTILKQRANNMFMAGISVRRLFGITHFGTNIKDLGYRVPDTEDITFRATTDAKYGFTSPAFNSGNGWGFDLGFTYKKTLKYIDNYTPYSKRNSCRKSEYKYKLGVSILDLGWISNKQDAYYGEIQREAGTWEDYRTTKINSAPTIDEKLTASFDEIDNPKRQYSAYLPTALSFQYDYNFENGFYINATIVQNLSFFNQLGVNRQNLLALTPRLELPRFEVSLPISMRRYIYPSIGLTFRLWNNIIIGTDRLTSLFINQDLYGMDIYFGIKLAKLYTNKCKYKLKNIKHKKYTTNDCFY